jgi:hypothetical protein
MYGFGNGAEANREAVFGGGGGLGEAAFGRDQIVDFLMLAAGHEEAYESLSAAQQVYTASGLAAWEGDTVRGVQFAEHSAVMHGMLDESRAHAIREEFKDAEEQKQLDDEKSGEWRKAAVSGGIGVVVGVGAAAVAGPAAGVATAIAVPLFLETAGSTAGTAYGTHTLQYLKDNEFKNDGPALEGASAVTSAGMQATWLPIEKYARGEELSVTAEGDLNNSVGMAYARGQDMIEERQKVG